MEAPLLAHDGFFHIYYPPLLLRSLESVIYRTLRKENPSKFGTEFGPVFERHVEKCLDCAGIEDWNEARLTAALPGEGKCVDFMVVEEGDTILIDAKAVEMSARGRVSYRAELLLQAIKASALKAIRQGVETKKRLAQIPGISGGAGDTFLVVVTFDDLFLGSNRDFTQIFGANMLPQGDVAEGQPLPLENIFFLTIKEFEDLLARILAGKTTFIQAFRHAQSEDADRRTQKFSFTQHLDTLCKQESRLPLIEMALEELFGRCLKYLEGKE